MITINGSVQRSFVFPADIPTAFDYYKDMSRTLNFLSHISILDRYDEERYRVLYKTTELSIYRVRIICDIQVESDPYNGLLLIHPICESYPVKTQSGLYSLSGQGLYSSESNFTSEGDQTRIDYKLELHASLPVPLGLRFMPGAVINSIARNITQWRINEIAEGFIERSVRAFVPQ